MGPCVFVPQGSCGSPGHLGLSSAPLPGSSASCPGPGRDNCKEHKSQ